MLLKILDALGIQQVATVRAQEAVTDRSGTITETGVAQVAVEANVLRSGWLLQNRGGSVIYLNERASATTGGSSFAIRPGEIFPPENFPLTTGAISVLGTAGDAYTLREW